MTTLDTRQASDDDAQDIIAEGGARTEPDDQLAIGQSVDSSDSAPVFWRSLAELEQTPEFAELLAREFPTEDPQSIPETSRRRFLQLMGASVALASLSACRWEEEEILPFAKRPEGFTPGMPKEFATALEIAGVAQPLLVRNYDGRPIKIEGNPEHPSSLGASSAFAQASVLGFCDPDRSRGVARREKSTWREAKWEAFEEALGERLAKADKNQGRGLAVIHEATSSPTFAALLARAKQRFGKAVFVEHESISRENVWRGSELAFGERVRSLYRIDKADVIVCFEDDPIGTHPDALRYARDWAKRRDPKADMNRVWAIESTPSATGGVADHRLPLRRDRALALMQALEARLIARLDDVAAPRFEGWLASEDVKRFVDAIVDDLAKHRGKALLCVGPRLPAEAHAIAHRLHERLGAVGKTIEYVEEPSKSGGIDDLAALSEAMRKGEVETLVMLGGNPVFDAPVDLGFGVALAKVPWSAHLSPYRDETSEACKWHVNAAHMLESWSDSRAWDGTLCTVQPQIDPLFGGKTAIEVLARIAGDELVRGLDLVRREWQGLAHDDGFDAFWRRALHDGFVSGSGYATRRPALRATSSAQSAAKAARSSASKTKAALELVLIESSSVYDGRFANNAWLQETPDPLTKITWDNALLLSPKTAELLGVEHETLVEVELGGRRLEVAACVTPGQAGNSLALALGYGRRAAGQVGGSSANAVASVGFDAQMLRTTTNLHGGSGVVVRPTGRPYGLATTQDHHAIDTVGMEERGQRIGALVRSGTLEDYKAHPDFAKHVVHHPPLVSLWEDPDGVSSKDGHKWGMTIDLSTCIGCNACVVGCTSENNVPVVGKEEVQRGREMHWIRVDRYFGGDDYENPDLITQPVTCQHCENAPCEQVCPVAATVHSEEGLNDMAYNRCIGTRYCANNCPYKVRRFNYFDYNQNFEKEGGELYELVVNPEVTVRSRGVMEKCSFCVQRIHEGKRRANREGRELDPNEIQAACQQACPTQAIVFGDLANERSDVRASASLDRAYQMLGELNNRPRTSYLARVSNPHPALAATTHGHGKGHGHGGHGKHSGQGKHSEHGKPSGGHE